jgi:hypothetical protein
MLENIPLPTMQEMWLRLDGAPPHWQVTALSRLDEGSSFLARDITRYFSFGLFSWKSYETLGVSCQVKLGCCANNTNAHDAVKWMLLQLYEVFNSAFTISLANSRHVNDVITTTTATTTNNNNNNNKNNPVTKKVKLSL